MSELTLLTINQLASQIRTRLVSPVEVVEAYLRRIEIVNPSLNAIVTIASNAMDLAHSAEETIMRGEKLGPLHGVPITIKDTIETAGLRTTAGSRVRAGYIPDHDADCVSKIKNAGAIILGKTNTAEMAAAYDTVNPVFGPTNNPYDLGCTSGGSSGGEAAAIAACISPGGLGSDLMGSVRVPAHFCGIVGLKPTTELSPCIGHIPSSSGIPSLGAAIGPMARTVEDVSMLFGIISSEKNVTHTKPNSQAENRVDLKEVRIAWHSFDGVSPVTLETKLAVEAAVRALENSGCNVIEERPPGVERGHELWSLLFAQAALDSLRAEYSGRENEAGPLIRYLLESSTKAPQVKVRESTLVKVERGRLRERLIEWMGKNSLIVAPVGATPALRHGERKTEIDGQSLSLFRAFSYSQTYNVFNLPAVSIPAGRSETGLPICVQIIGKPFEEELVLKAAHVVEQTLGGWQMPPLTLSNNPVVRL